uniref:ethanolamine-phosphate cytidylyltransferase n=1 Tax=Pseudo-nitzschia australis TaxID=44445 RepID=A0A7S4AB31_9STRA
MLIRFEIRDVYETAKKVGKFRTIPRTEGVSTTDILGRMLLLTTEHHMKGGTASALGSQSKFLTTTRLLQLFSENVKTPTEDMRVIYIDGAWDLFHPGHVALLKAAKERGDYLIVGIHGDVCVNKMRGMNLPLLNLHERVLSVLGCRFVDDILIDAPYEISAEMIASLRIAEVIHGACDVDREYCSDEDDRYRNAKEKGIFHSVKNPCPFSLKTIFKRIRQNQKTFQVRFERKMNTEAQHYEQKYSDNGSH